MLVAAQIAFELEQVVSDGSEEVRELKDADRIARAVRRTSAWLDTPGQFARDGVNPRLGGFHDASNVAKATENLLILLRDDGMKFFDWLGSHGADQSSYRLSLSNLVSLRNDVAHQLGLGLQPTAPELVMHQKRLAVLVRGIRAYTRGAARGTGNAPGMQPVAAAPTGGENSVG